MRATLGALILGLSAASVEAGELYRWVDDAGRVVFGPNPPPGAKELELFTGSKAGGGNPASSPSRSPGAGEEAEEKIGGMRRDEWTYRAEQLKLSLEGARKEVRRLQEIAESDANRSTRSRAQRDIIKGTRKAVEHAKRRVEAAEQAQTDFRENARRQGVPAHWYMR